MSRKEEWLKKYPELAESDLDLDDEDLDEDDILMEVAFIRNKKAAHVCKYNETVKKQGNPSDK